MPSYRSMIAWSLLVTTAVASSATEVRDRAWQADQISVLFPLPQRGEEQLLLGPASGQTLLPRRVFDMLPRLVLDMDPDRLYKQSLRVIGLRIDPCFQEGPGPCRKMIRLIWQPIVLENEVWTTLDSGVHSFYDLSETQFDELLHEVQRLPRPIPWKAWLPILKRFCQTQNLTRATAMGVNPLGTVWTFAGLDFENGKAKDIPIFGTNDNLQGVFVSAEKEDSTEFMGMMNPYPEGQVQFMNVLSSTRRAKNQMTEDELVEATRTSLALENPRLRHTGNTDCASCHLARAITSWSLQSYPQWNWEKTFTSELFAEKNGLVRPAYQTGGANILRHFGYFNSVPVISRRVRNEMQISLDILNAKHSPTISEVGPGTSSP